MLIHKKRPTDTAGQKAWDYIVQKLGQVQSIVFFPQSCKGQGAWIATVNNRTYEVSSEEIRQFYQK